MKSPVAKHMNTYNKASVVRHKHVSMREAVSLQEMEEDAAQSVLRGLWAIPIALQSKMILVAQVFVFQTRRNNYESFN